MREQQGEWVYPLDEEKSEAAGYLVFTPQDWDGRRPLPMLIFLHGAGYRGKELNKLYQDELIRQIHEGIWPNAHRHAWETAYRDPAMWEWLFSQKRKSSDPP